jgi:hypothetical protein
MKQKKGGLSSFAKASAESRTSCIPVYYKTKKGGLSSFAHASLETRPRSIPYFIKQKKGGPLLLRKCFGGISAKFYSVFHETKKRGAFPPSQMLRWNIGQVVLLCIIKQKKGGPFLLRTCFVGNSATFYSVFLKTKKGGLSSFANASVEYRPSCTPMYYKTKKRGAFPPSQMLRWNIGQVVLLCIIKQKKGGPFGTPLLHQSTSY